MNEALPRWRTFSSGAAGEAPSSPPIATAEASGLSGTASHWVALVAAALGGGAAGAALALVAMVSFVDLAPTGGSELGQLTSVPFAVSGGTVDTAGNGMDNAVGPNTLMDFGTGGELVVDVAGAVQEPGLHRLRSGDRVADAIDAAGGYAARVDLAAASSSLNLAELLTDGAKVVVPELGMEAAALTAPADDRIDLNTADQAALESLPGIGPVTAGKIMAARSARAFASVGELLDRDIVGQAVYDDIVGLVRVSL